MRSSLVLDDNISEKKRESSPSEIEGSSSEEANFNHLLEEEGHMSQAIVPQSFKLPTYDYSPLPKKQTLISRSSFLDLYEAASPLKDGRRTPDFKIY